MNVENVFVLFCVCVCVVLVWTEFCVAKATDQSYQLYDWQIISELINNITADCVVSKK